MLFPINLFSPSLLLKIFTAFIVILPCLSWGGELQIGNFQSILNSRTNELKVWNFSGNSNIYVFDFAGLTPQGRTFNRVTQLTEQVQNNLGYPKVLNNDEFTVYLDSLRRSQANFAFGHDLLVGELVLFFNLAEKDKIELFPEEIFLRDFLIQQNLMKVWRGFFQSIQPGVVILSIPQTQEKKEFEPLINDLARLAIFTHEISHGEYYTNPYYATYCQKFWSQSLNDTQRESFVNLFKKYNYNISSYELVVNEMQAYLMFTPDPNSFNASKLGITDEELESLREMFRQGKPPTKLPLN